MNESVNSSRVQHGNDIELLELVRSVWEYRLFIFLAVLVGGALASAYAFLSKPVYEVKVSFVPPLSGDIAPLSSGRAVLGLTPFSVSDVYSVFAGALDSEDSLRTFFSAYYMASLSAEERANRTEGKLFRRLLKELKVVAPDKIRPDRYSVIAQGEDPERIARLVSAYIEQVGKVARERAVQNAHREVKVAVSNLHQQIASMRSSAEARRKDRIVQLKEALKVSESVGLVEPPVLSGQPAEQLTAIMDGNLTYMRGSRALRAEIEALESRASVDPFIPQLRGLEEKAELYASVIAESPVVDVFRQDGGVIVPDEPIKPKKLLIIFLGVILGGGLSALFVVVFVVLRSSRQFKRSA